MPAYMIAGFPPHFAIGTNKLSAGMGTLVSTYRFGKSGNIPWKSAIPCVLMAVIGSAAGARIALLVSADLFKKIMLVIIPVTAYYVLKTKNLDIEREPLSQSKTIFRACLAALSHNITHQGPGRQGCLGRKGFCGGCSTARRRSWSLTGSCGWVVSSLPE